MLMAGKTASAAKVVKALSPYKIEPARGLSDILARATRGDAG
jgi:hypothetical protein